VGIVDKLFPRPVTPEQYAKLVIAEFRRHDVAATSATADPFELSLDDGSKAFLNNGYALYCRATNAERPEKLANFVAGLLRWDRNLTRDKLHQLLPVVRSSVYYSVLDLMRRAEKWTNNTAPAHEAFAPGLATGLVVDSERAMSHVQASDLDKLGLTFSEALKIAINNLEAGFDHTLVEHADGLFIGDWSDGYASSRILLPSVWSGLRFKGAPLIHIPCRDKFFVFGDADTYAMELALILGQEEIDGAYPLSADIFTYRDGKWKCGVPGAPETKSIQDRMVRKKLALDYAQQKELLDRIYEQEHIDVFVASYMLYEVVEPPDEFSAAVWSRGIPTMLPLSEKVVLLIDTDTKESIRVHWADLRKICKELMPRVKGLHPIRFQLLEFPDAEQIEQLRSVAIR
jgi:hypothetical protein